jgi:hypothetical protein
MAALIMRALDLGIITVRQRKYLFQQLSVRGWRVREPANLDVPAERPQSLPHLATLVYGAPLDTAQFASDVNLSSKLVEEFIAAHIPDAPDVPLAPGPGKILSLGESANKG